MKIKVMQTTDGKYEGMIFEVEEISSATVKQVTGKDFDFGVIEYISADLVKLQSSNYTAILKILE